jgi:hypothetical protein
MNDFMKKVLVLYFILIASFYDLHAQDFKFSDSTSYKNYLDSGWTLYYERELEEAKYFFIKAFDLETTQEVINEVLVFYLKTQQYEEAEIWLNRSKGMFGTNFYNAGFALILDIVFNRVSYKDSEIYSKYERTYGKKAADWLSELLTFL